MKHAALPLLCCPTCRSGRPDLQLETDTVEGDEIVAGRLSCPAGHRYPIRDGIPDFVEDREAVGQDSPVYDAMWRMHPDRRYTGRVEEYTRKFQRFAQLPEPLESYVRGKIVLDGGCGEGRFTFLMSALGARHVIALDYAPYALRRARMQSGNPPNASFIRASILNPPLVPEAFDFVFSMGVLHHTPDSKKSFQAIRTALKPGGFLSIYVYRTLSLPLAGWPLRLITRRMSVDRVERLSVFFGWHYDPKVKPTISIGGLGRRLGRWDVLGLGHVSFEGLSTPYLREHSRGEAVRWFEDTNMRVISSSHLVSVSGQATAKWP